MKRLKELFKTYKTTNKILLWDGQTYQKIIWGDGKGVFMESGEFWNYSDMSQAELDELINLLEEQRKQD